jgi:hypothetical protein
LTNTAVSANDRRGREIAGITWMSSLGICADAGRTKGRLWGNAQLDESTGFVTLAALLLASKR